jgi:hypothetical protein
MNNLRAKRTALHLLETVAFGHGTPGEQLAVAIGRAAIRTLSVKEFARIAERVAGDKRNLSHTIMLRQWRE